MLKELAYFELHGTRLMLIYSPAAKSYYVQYGLEQTQCDNLKQATKKFKECISHALEFIGG